MSYKFIYIDPVEKTRIEGVIQSSLRNRNMELAFVRSQQIQKAVDRQNKISTKKSKAVDIEVKDLIKKLSKEQLYTLIQKVSK